MTLGNSIKTFAKKIKIYDVDLEKIRLGNNGDGGYVVLKEVCNQTNTISSYGIGDDLSFELDFLKHWQNTIISLFDPFIDELPSSHPNFNFYKTGVGEKYPGCVMSSDLLKMDIEGDEWSVFRTMSWMTLFSFSQIIVEFHVFHVISPAHLSPYFNDTYRSWSDSVNIKQFSVYSSVLELLNLYFVCFHAHVNNSLPMMELDGFLFPPLIEMSFVKRGLVGKISPFIGSLPIEGLDYPNKTDRPDIIDWYPLIRRRSCEFK